MKAQLPAILFASCVVVAVQAASPPGRASGVPETLSQEQIDAGMAKVRPRADACAAKGGQYKGRMVIAVKVGPSGEVQSASVAQSAPTNAAVGSCIAGATRSTSFAASKNGTSFQYPFQF